MCAQVVNSYHVRVLVPCYKEDLEIVAKTIQAAYNARLPDNCSRTIYLCDDGKDKRKRKWCAAARRAACLPPLLGTLLASAHLLSDSVMQGS